MDAIIQAPVDVQIDLIHRRGTVDTIITTTTNHYDPVQTPMGVEKIAQMFDYTEPNAPEVPYESGDQLVLRWTMTSTCPVAECYIPNADGQMYQGRIPHIDIPH